MGISGLLGALKSIQKHCTLKKFAGQTIGIDAYGWLHRGTVTCAVALALDKPTTGYIDFVVGRVRMLLDFGITPYLVFDGDDLPSKAATNEARHKRRAEAKALGVELQRAGKTSQAYQEFQKAVDVTPRMARMLIEELKKLNVQYVVAPYEADAQLVYLEQKGIINGILSEDSDMLVFGAKRLLTKLNQYGECIEVERADFPACKELNLAGWTDGMFRRMAILSGCDYLPNISKIGLRTAYGYIRKYKEAEKAIRMIQFEGKHCVPAEYADNFKKAELTFVHHRVFCPIEQKMVFLNPLLPGLNEDDMPYLGPHVEPEVAIGVACGDLDPFTKEAIQFTPRPSQRPTWTENRRQTYATPATIKPSKSIDNFFKRQPLAELDPNSLTPSPSQQRVLDMNRNAAWEPRLVSSAPQTSRTSSLAAATPHTHLHATSTTRTSFLANAARISTYQPPKRQRLCSDSSEIHPDSEIKQSPFFASKVDQGSPLALKRPRPKRPKGTAFEVFSDEPSSEKVSENKMQQEASPETRKNRDTSTKTRISGGTEDDLDQIPQSSPTAGSIALKESPVAQRAPIPIAIEAQRGNPKMVSRNDNLEEFEDLLEYHVRKQNESLQNRGTADASGGDDLVSRERQSLLRTFAHQPQVKRDAALRGLSGTKTGNDSHHNGSPCGQSETPGGPPRSGHIERLSNTFGAQSSQRQAMALKTLGQKRASAEKPTSKSNAPATCEMGSESRASVKDNVRGSEDAIVPNSEGESSDGDEGAGSKPRIDLSSYAFVRV